METSYIDVTFRKEKKRMLMGTKIKTKNGFFKKNKERKKGDNKNTFFSFSFFWVIYKP